MLATRMLLAVVGAMGIALCSVGCGGENIGGVPRVRVEGTEPGDCDDNADNDSDGLFDCGDPGCATSPSCAVGGTGGAGGTGGVGGAGGTGGVGGTGGTGGVGGAGGTGGVGGAGGVGGVGGAGGAGGTGGVGGAGGVGGVGGAGGAGGVGGVGGAAGTGGAGGSMLCQGVDCDDGKECTGDACDPLDGQCVHTNVPDGTACDFGGLPGLCSAGLCEDAMLCAGVNCDDGNECTGDTCDPLDGQCDHTNVPDGTACDFGGSPGFCSGGTCSAEPCDTNALCHTCPKNHVCRVTPTANFCVRTHQTCHQDEDCAGLGEFCADIDGDGSTECAGELGATETPCVTANCSGSTPVCEAGASGVTATCGDYGLCLTNSDCDEANDFECVALWQDGRKECVLGPTSGTCVDQVTVCDPQQVCASPRNGGGVPSCQTGTAP